MATQRIAFRTDADLIIGTGHFMRCLTLADEMKKHDAEVCFVARGLPPHLAQMLHDRNISLCLLPESLVIEEIDELQHAKWLKTSQHQDALQTVRVIGKVKFDWFVVDHYAIDYRWEKIIRSVANNVMVIDDLADRKHACDILLDQNFSQNMRARYSGKISERCQLLLGPSFALLREEFREERKRARPRKGDIKNVLVFFGGVDVENYTSTALMALIRLDFEFNVKVVIGEQHPNASEVYALCKAHGFECHFQTKEMAKLMAQADLAIGAGGSSVWERFCMGVPSVCISTVENQRQQINELQLAGLVYAQKNNHDVIDFICEAILSMLADPQAYRKMSERIYGLVDGHGASKICNLFFSGDVDIRRASEADSVNIFNWRNDPVIREYSLSTDEIKWSDHKKWFSEVCGQLSRPVLIGEIQNRAIGVVRFDVRDRIAIISIYLVPNAGNQGLGQKLLTAAEKWLRNNHPEVLEVHAKVVQANKSSVQLFTRMQYIGVKSNSSIDFIKEL